MEKPSTFADLKGPRPHHDDLQPPHPRAAAQTQRPQRATGGRIEPKIWDGKQGSLAMGQNPVAPVNIPIPSKID